MNTRKHTSIILLLLIVSFLFPTVSSCKKKTPVETSAISEVSEPTTKETILQTPTPSPTPVPEYDIGVVIPSDNNIAYVYEEKDTSGKPIGATVDGVDFLILEKGDDWCKILYGPDEVGYIKTAKLSISVAPEPPPLYEAHFFMEAKEEPGHIPVAFNNKLIVVPSTYTVIEKLPESDSPDAPLIDVEVTKTRIDVFTTAGELLAEDTTLILKNAKIYAAPIPTLEPSPTPPPDTTIADPALPSDGFTDPSNTDPSDTPVETVAPTPPPTPIPVETVAPTPTPAPIPIEIVVSNGTITSVTGVTLDVGIPFDIAQDKGQVVTETGEVIAYQGIFFAESEVVVTDGRMPVIDGELYIESGYYFKPAVLIDELVDVRRHSDSIYIDMMMTKEDSIAGGNVYGQQICLLQQGTLNKLLEADKMFQEDGYSIIIYDAYRPYSVTCTMYDIHKNGTYVAGKRFGSVHNKGAAIDMSLVDNTTGEPIEMPSPIHTLNETSNRTYPKMTDTAKENMIYMADIMKKAGFTTIQSEWWHFSDSESSRFLRTDYDLKAQTKIITSTEYVIHTS
ncbi:MAG: M15 family metallopeptidase [Clostridiaceae bacterium]|nr:M15 family metallopeptidase [Clostridiaceae bacterium]